jgi:restriction system protein
MGLLRHSPIWVGPLVAVGVFLIMRFVAPPLLRLTGQDLGGVFADLAYKLAILGGPVVLVLWMVAEITKLGRRRFLDRQADINSVRDLSWQEFEHLVGEAYRRKGYDVDQTLDGPDGGVDLILTRDGETTFVQCKQWKARKVGVKVARELYGVMAAHGAAHGIVVSCGEFTEEALRFASGNPLELVNGQALWQLVEQVKRDKEPKPVIPPTEGPAPTMPVDASEVPQCPMCGAVMVLRTDRKGQHAGSRFYGCSRYPKCRGIREAN